MLIVNLLPKSYGNCFLVRHALGEIIACQGILKNRSFRHIFDCNQFVVLQPGIDALCDPDIINQHLLLQLRIQQLMKKNYAYAASYEDLVSLIETCEDQHELSQLRFQQYINRLVINIKTVPFLLSEITSLQRSPRLQPSAPSNVQNAWNSNKTMPLLGQVKWIFFK